MRLWVMWLSEGASSRCSLLALLDVSVACQALLLRFISAREQLRRIDTLLA